MRASGIIKDEGSGVATMATCSMCGEPDMTLVTNKGTSHGLGRNRLAREFIFILPIIYIFTGIWGQNGIWPTFPVADTLAVILALVWIVIQSRRLGIHFQLRYPSEATATHFD